MLSIDRFGRVDRTTDNLAGKIDTVAAPAERVRGAVAAVYGDMGIPLTSVNFSTGEVGNPGFAAVRRIAGERASRAVDCGSSFAGPLADEYSLRTSVVTYVRPLGATASTIESRVDAMGKPLSVSGDEIHCTSTGMLERRISAKVKEQIVK
ncbi:MAG: hypothetical protein NVS1B4_14310 [Gemmatimonadaceae bacterium]